MTEAYPLQWPQGWPRTPPYRRENDTRFGGRGGITVGRARDQLMDELRRLGAIDIVVSTNVPVKADGLLYADNKRLDDPGIAVYFKFKNKPMVMARDGFVSVAGNLRSLGLAIEGLRQLERHGGSLIARAGLRRLPGDRTARLEKAVARSLRHQTGLGR